MDFTKACSKMVRISKIQIVLFLIESISSLHMCMLGFVTVLCFACDI